MRESTFKLGDKVVITAGKHAGHEGHVVGITQLEAQGAAVSVRLDTDRSATITVAPEEIRLTR